MINVGIVNPNWTFQKHNTDARCVIDFSNLDSFSKNLALQFVGSKYDYLKANINYVSQRLFNRKVFNSINLSKGSKRVDVLYRYGGDVLGLTINPDWTIPVMSTMGFPTLNQDNLRGNSYLQKEAEKLVGLAKDFRLIHFHTDCMREQFLSLKPEWREKCITIPFFLPYLKFSTEKFIVEKFTKNSEVFILFVGADGVRKGLIDLCDALDSISVFLNLHRVSVVVVSKTKPTCKQFKNIVHHLSLNRESVQELMQQSHIYAMVPELESFGLVYVEAMAAGCAILADDDVPRQEILDSGHCGRLVQSRNSSLIALELKKMIEDRSAMLDIALKSWRRAKEKYSPEVVSKQYAQAFTELIKSN